MCLAADIPLIESGTAGYLGQVTVIKKVRKNGNYAGYYTVHHKCDEIKCTSKYVKEPLLFQGLTECYECQPKPAQKTFPGCTIRNTPSEPIHCIVWAKHLFK